MGSNHAVNIIFNWRKLFQNYPQNKNAYHVDVKFVIDYIDTGHYYILITFLSLESSKLLLPYNTNKMKRR